MGTRFFHCGSQVDITNKIEGAATEQPAFPSAPSQTAPAQQADTQNAAEAE